MDELLRVRWCLCLCMSLSVKNRKKGEWAFQRAQLQSQLAAFEDCGSPLSTARAASGQCDCSGSRGSRATNAFEIPTQNVWEKTRLFKKTLKKEACLNSSCSQHQ